MADTMLDCVMCGGRKWRALELEQVNELKESGAVLLVCDSCRRSTYWRPSENGRRAGKDRRWQPEAIRPDAVERILGGERVASQPPPDKEKYRTAAVAIYEAERRSGDDRRQAFQRSHDRVPLQLAIRVRVNTRGLRFEEKTNTMNVSREGVYFRSRLPYQKGLSVHVALNYSATDPASNIENPATVVRIEPPAGDGTKGVGLLLQR